MFSGALDGRVRALYVMGEDIAQTDPDSHHVRAAIEACELVVSQEIFLSETARLADVVLPAASFLEKDGTFVNFDRRFQRVRPRYRLPATPVPTSTSCSGSRVSSARTSVCPRRPRRWPSAQPSRRCSPVSRTSGSTALVRAVAVPV